MNGIGWKSKISLDQLPAVSREQAHAVLGVWPDLLLSGSHSQ